MNAVAVATSTSATITYAYVGDGSTFKILEVSHTSPKFTIIEKGKISLGATINGIEIIEGSSRRYAYVAAGSAGVRILDVTDIDFPAQIGVFSSANQAFSVRYFQSLFPNYLFVADGTNGLRIITLNDPQNPTQFAIKDTPGSVQDVYVASTSYAYIADYTSGLRILNISGLPGINEDSYENDRTKKSNSVSGFGNFALMADEDSGIINIDITNLSTLPTPISPKPSPLVSMKGFDIEKDSLSNFYIVGGDRYYILNSAFVTQKFSTILHDAHDIAILDNYAYIADGAYGLQVFDNSSTLTDTIGSFDPSILAYDVVISGNSAYVADYNGRLVRLGLSTPNAPSLEGSAYLPDPVSCSYPTNKGNPYAVGIDSANIYVAANDGDLRWHDINTFINDVVLLCPASSVCNGGYAKGITVPGDGWIYVACNDTGVAKGTSPLSGFIPPYSVSGLANGLKVSGNNIYVAAYQKGLQILTTSGVLAGYYPTSGTVPGNYHNVGRYSHFAFAVADTAGLQVINLATPGAPFLETSLDTPGNAINITIVDTTAFIADSGSGIEVIDIGNPTYPKTLCTYNTEGIARSVAISGKYVFVADDSNGLVVLQMPMTPTPKP